MNRKTSGLSYEFVDENREAELKELLLQAAVRQLLSQVEPLPWGEAAKKEAHER